MQLLIKTNYLYCMFIALTIFCLGIKQSLKYFFFVDGQLAILIDVYLQIDNLLDLKIENGKVWNTYGKMSDNVHYMNLL